MKFYKNGKDSVFTDNPRIILVKDPCGSWGIFEATEKPGNFQRVAGFHYLKDAKAEAKRRYTKWNF